MNGYCYICGRNEKTKHLPLCVYGSEGVDICRDCEKGIVEHINTMNRIAHVCWKDGYLIAKKFAAPKTKPDTKTTRPEDGE